MKARAERKNCESRKKYFLAKMSKISPKLREAIRKKRNVCIGYTQIAHELGVAPSAVRYWADPDYKKKTLERASDPKQKKYHRKYYQERRKDPEYREKKKAKVKEYRLHHETKKIITMKSIRKHEEEK